MISMTHCKARAQVQLPDGRIGLLINMTPKSRVCRVLVDGRHERIPADQLRLMSQGDPIIDGREAITTALNMIDSHEVMQSTRALVVLAHLRDVTNAGDRPIVIQPNNRIEVMR